MSFYYTDFVFFFSPVHFFFFFDNIKEAKKKKKVEHGIKSVFPTRVLSFFFFFRCYIVGFQGSGFFSLIRCCMAYRYLYRREEFLWLLSFLFLSVMCFSLHRHKFLFFFFSVSTRNWCGAGVDGANVQDVFWHTRIVLGKTVLPVRRDLNAFCFCSSFTRH